MPSAWQGPVAPQVDDRLLHLILMPTEQCNFRCTYCYEDFELGCMPRDVIDGVNNLLTRRIPTLRRLEIGWFGGEPLMAMPVIREISNHILALIEDRSDLTYVTHVTTNGYLLTRATLEELLRLRVNAFHVSLDGAQPEHDGTRVRADGGRTFDRIWSNLLDMADSKHRFRVVLRLHVHPGNVESVRRLARDVEANFGSDSRFQYYFNPVGRLGGRNDDELDVLSSLDQQSILDDLRSEASSDSLYAPSPGSICYAAKANSMTVRANGDLLKCTVSLNHPRNQIGRLRADGTLSDINQENFRWWVRGLESRDPIEVGCPNRALGAGPLPAAKTAVLLPFPALPSQAVAPQP